METTIKNSVISVVIFFHRIFLEIGKILIFLKYDIKAFLLLLKKEAGPTDVYTISRHIILSAYLWGISIPFLEKYGQIFVTITTFIVTIIVTFIFLGISKENGFILALINIVFGKREKTKLIVLSIFDPYVFSVKLASYLGKKNLLVYIFTIASIFLACFLWGWFVNSFGKDIQKIFPDLLSWIWQRAGILIIFYVRA